MNISYKFRLTGLEDKAQGLELSMNQCKAELFGTARLSVCFFMIHNRMTQTYWKHWFITKDSEAPCDAALTWLM